MIINNKTLFLQMCIFNYRLSYKQLVSNDTDLTFMKLKYIHIYSALH